MVRGIIIFISWLCFVTANAQQIIEKHIDFSGREEVSLKIQIADSVKIQTWNKDEVYVKGSVNVNDNKDNDAYATSFREDGKRISVDAKFQENYFKGKKNCCNDTEIYWQVFVPEKARLSLETINADITLSGTTRALDVKSISGYIDLAVSSTRAADVGLSTISGRIYSDLDLHSDKAGSGVPMKISGKLNQGGIPIRLETISGDIFLRKSQ